MNDWHIHLAAQVVRNGGVVAYPTETVWGLGCDPFDFQAVSLILEMKQRPWKKGLILISSEQNDFASVLDKLPQDTRQEMFNGQMGPTTWLVRDESIYPAWIRGAHNSVAIRVTDHPTVRELTRRLGGPIVSTSANLKGRPPARTALQAVRYFGAQLDFVLPGSIGVGSQPSRIIDSGTGRILRA